MSYRQIAYAYSAAPAYAKRPRRVNPQNVIGASALSFVGFASLGMLAFNIFGDNVTPVASNDTGAEIVTISRQRSTEARNAVASLFSSSYSLGGPRVTFETPALAKGDRLDIAERTAALAQTALAKGDRLAVRVIDQAPQQVARLETPPQDIQTQAPAMQNAQLANARPTQTVEVLANIPLPPPRPALADAQSKAPSAREIAQANKPAMLANAAPPSAPRKALTIFEKLFGVRDQPSNTQLAYASPDGGVTGSIPTRSSDIAAGMSAPYDKQTAVYDITARTVYLPDGTRLEAHSGLGSRLDDPRSMRERMRGVTPPHVYDLALRESLFHGVEALRLKPVGGEDAIFGRSGLLAHTYMLGPNGDSNGCVSFRDYNRFLRAYKSGEVKRLVVVAKVD